MELVWCLCASVCARMAGGAKIPVRSLGSPRGRCRLLVCVSETVQRDGHKRAKGGDLCPADFCRDIARRRTAYSICMMFMRTCERVLVLGRDIRTSWENNLDGLSRVRCKYPCDACKQRETERGYNTFIYCPRVTPLYVYTPEKNTLRARYTV